METSPSENHKTVASLIHLSTFSKYFFPLGNFLLPLLLWTVNKEKPFVNEHGRQAINFQLSIFLYALAIGIICIPFISIFATDFEGLIHAIDNNVHHTSFNDMRNFSGYVVLFFIVALLLFGLFIFELYAIITATSHANQGKLYKYPITIQFIKPVSDETESINQSENESTNQ